MASEPAQARRRASRSPPGRAGARVRAAASTGFDSATLIGLCGGLVLTGAVLMVDGSVSAFVDIPALLIVTGGTVLVTMTSFNMSEIVGTQRLVVKSARNGTRDPHDVARHMLRLSTAARKDVLGLERQLPQLMGEPFLARGLRLVIDGSPADEIEQVMRNEMLAIAQRHGEGARVLHRAAEVAPAMGLIGTLIGLVRMLRNLEDPSAIGPAMSVALLTTFYGAILANMVFAPLAAKLEKKSSEELLVNELYLMGALSIARQENPRNLETHLNAVLPPAKRVRYFD